MLLFRKIVGYKRIFGLELGAKNGLIRRDIEVEGVQ